MTWIGRDALGRITDFSAESSTSDADVPPNITVTGGAVEQTVLSRTVTLTRADILAMRGNPVVIIPATEVLDYSGSATSVPLLLFASAVLDRSATAYNNVPNPLYMALCYGSDFSLAASYATEKNTSSPAATIRLSDGFSTFGAAQITKWAFLFPGNMGEHGGLPKSGNIHDNGLYLTFVGDGGGSDTVGEMTGGAASDTITVKVVYTILDL